ncbi:hypothetical protein ABIA39_007010 [Nocardia sp. GAS34]
MQPDGPATIPTDYVTRQSTRIIANGYRDYRADSIAASDHAFPYPSQTATTRYSNTSSAKPRN